MWTCGIDIATQQLRLAMTSMACSAPGDSPRGRGDHDAGGKLDDAGSVGGGRLLSTRVSGNMVTAQDRAIPTCAWRQPTLSIKCWMIGGQSVPAR